jgi:hypothetical protein
LAAVAIQRLWNVMPELAGYPASSPAESKIADKR